MGIDVEKKFANMENDSERKVARFLQKIGFTFVDSNSNFGESLNELLGEIDSLFTLDDYLFLIEVSDEKISNEKKFTFFTKWADPDILDVIKNKYELRPKKIIRMYFDLYTQTPTINKSPLLQILTKAGKLNIVVYSDNYDSLVNSVTTASEFLNRLDLLSYLKPEKTFKTILRRFFR
jgi:hypothetical protein